MTCYNQEDLINPLSLNDHFMLKGWRLSTIFFFLHFLVTLGLWKRLFKLVSLDWVPPRSICDIMTISYEILGSSIRGEAL